MTVTKAELTTVDSIDIKAQLPLPNITSTPQHNVASNVAASSSKPVNSPLLDRARKIRARASPRYFLKILKIFLINLI